jgi:hypothetical protein
MIQDGYSLEYRVRPLRQVGMLGGRLLPSECVGQGLCYDVGLSWLLERMIQDGYSLEYGVRPLQQVGMLGGFGSVAMLWSMACSHLDRWVGYVTYLMSSHGFGGNMGCAWASSWLWGPACLSA